MAKALILDAHSRAGLETLQSLGRHGVETDIASDRPDALATRSRYPRRVMTQPASPHALAAWLSSVRPDAYDLIVPSTELSLTALRELSENDPIRRRAVIPDDRAIDIALDKEATRMLAADLGIATPATELVPPGAQIPDWDVYPIVLKPVRSKLTIDGAVVTEAPCIASTASERNAFLRRLLPHTAIQQQAYVQGRGFGVELLFANGDPLWTFVHERIHEYPLTGGGSTYRRSVAPVEALVRPAVRLLSALRWHGVAMVEFKWDGKAAPYLMEINPRLWGSLALSIDAGVDFPLGLFQVATGHAPAPQPSYRTGYYTRDLLMDLEWQKDNLKADHSNPLLFTRPSAQALIELLRPVWGRESWDHFDWRDLGVTAALIQRIARHWAGRLLRMPLREAQDRWLLRAARAKLGRLSRLNTRIDRLLFVCHGNICRSPLAEHLATNLMPDKTITSAGFHPTTGRKSPPNMREAALSLGVDLASHTSRPIDATMARDAQLILLMDRRNLEAMKQHFPEVVERCLPLGLFLSVPRAEIDDPYGKSHTEALDVAKQIMEAVSGLRAWLNSQG